MTVKQATHCMKFNCELAVCEECDLYGTVGTDHCFEDACREAIKALEKQIPKEPKKESMCSGNAFDSWDKYNCPDCNNFLHSGARSLVSKYTMPKYCCRCGQALKWE